MLKVSAFYLEKQKSFIPKKIYFRPLSISKQKSFVYRPNFQWRFWANFFSQIKCQGQYNSWHLSRWVNQGQSLATARCISTFILKFYKSWNNSNSFLLHIKKKNYGRNIFSWCIKGLWGTNLMQSHYKEVTRWEIFMEQELRFGLDLGRFGNFWGRFFYVFMGKNFFKKTL